VRAAYLSDGNNHKINQRNEATEEGPRTEVAPLWFACNFRLNHTGKKSVLKGVVIHYREVETSRKIIFRDIDFQNSLICEI
jgi:hypothetical protein